jgi:HK97 family phage major capsid protein
MNLMEKILKAKEDLQKVSSEIRSILDGDSISEKKEDLNKLEKRFDEMSEGVLSMEKQLERERKLGEVKEEKRSGNKEDNKEDKQLIEFRKMLKNERNEYRDLQMDNPAQAGYLVAPQKFSSQVIKDLDDILHMRKFARKFTLEGAHSLGFPKRTARASTFAWGSEIATPTTDSSLAYGKREFKPQYASGLIKVSKAFLKNAPYAENEVKKELVYDVATNLEQAYMTGDGVGQPLGIFTASDNGISTSRDVSTGNTTTNITFDGLKEAFYSIKEQHRINLKWIFHRDAMKKIAKIKDGNGQYILQESVRAGEPQTIFGVSVYMSEYAPNTFTTGQYVGIIGNFDFYYICDSLDMEMQTLVEKYATSNQLGYIYRVQTDGMPVVEDAFARITLA